MLPDVRIDAANGPGGRRRNIQDRVARPEPRVAAAEYAARRTRVVDAVGDAGVQIENLNLDHVSWFRAAHVDWTCEDVGAVADLRRSNRPPILCVLQHFIGLDAELPEIGHRIDGAVVPGLRNHVDADRVARSDRCGRRLVDRIPAEHQRFWSRSEEVVGTALAQLLPPFAVLTLFVTGKRVGLRTFLARRSRARSK